MEVYYFEVEDYHTYFVGNVSVLVHNDCTDAEMRFDYGALLRSYVGDPPEWMVRPHAHHIIYKRGLGLKQRRLSKRGQEILRYYGIDPIKGPENLVWASNVKGLHTVENLEKIVDELEMAHKNDSNKETMIKILKKYGEIAQNWSRNHG